MVIQQGYTCSLEGFVIASIGRPTADRPTATTHIKATAPGNLWAETANLDLTLKVRFDSRNYAEA